MLRDFFPSPLLTVNSRPAHAQQPTVVWIQDSARSVEGLEPLFGHPIPPWKRGIDIVSSLLGLFLLAPLLLLVTITIKIVSPGPVIFKQERVGYLGKTFTLWKFRTMKVNSDSSLHQQHLSQLINVDQPMKKLGVHDDPRIIPLGHILRHTYLDELPQLVNVLRGDMSLVGPRPCLPYEAQAYLLWQTVRFDTIPGLTGLWQVSGKNRTTFKEMIRLDIVYAKQKSFWLDIKILLKTLYIIIKSEGQR